MNESQEEQSLLEKARQEPALSNEYVYGYDTGDDSDPDGGRGDKRNALFGKFTSKLALAMLASTLGGSFIIGYNLVSMNTPEAYIQAFINSSLQRYVSQPGQTSLTIVWSITVAIFILSGCIGAFTFGYLADRLGRRNALFVGQIGSVASVVFFATSLTSGYFELLIVGRVLVGWSAGVSFGLVPLYLTEIAPLNLRGVAGCINQLGVVIGALFGQLLGLNFLLGSPTRWPALLAFTGVPNIISFALLPFCPESPSFLLLKLNQVDAAEKSLRQLRKEKNVSLAIAAIRHESEQQSGCDGWSISRLLSTRELLLPLALVCVANAAQQLSGINAVLCYSQQIFTAANVPAGDSQFAVLATGLVLVVMTVVTTSVIERAGRRPLLLASTAGVVVFLVLLTITIELQNTVAWLAYLSVIWVAAYMAVFTLGLGCIPPFLGAEMFTLGPRAPVMSVAALINWICNFLIVVSFPFMQLSIGGYSFLIFAGISAVFFIFLALKLPETNKKSIAEIYEQL